MASSDLPPRGEILLVADALELILGLDPESRHCHA